MKFRLIVVLAISILICFIGCSKVNSGDSPDINDQSKLMYASEDVNMRDGASVSNLIISVILRGEEVKVYSDSNGWSKIQNNNLEGYVKTSFLSKEKPLTYEQMALKIMKTMTIEEKVGQMFFVRCRKDTAIADLGKYYLGGFILFNADIEGETKDTLKNTLKNYQDYSKIKLLIGTDEEGGTINRLSLYSQFRKVPFYSPQELYIEGGYPLIVSDTEEKATLLKNLGINVNLAPVSDVSTNSTDYIYARTFGKEASETAKYMKTVVETMNANKIGSTLKHFPGYGNNVDTHTGIAIDNRSYDSFVNSDFIPFRAGIESGVGSILVSHNIVMCMDENLPASLSPAVHKILRDYLGFKGVIMTDDLKMDAIKKYIGDEVSAVLAIKAGNDLIIASNFDTQIPSVLAAVKNGTITENLIDESVLRILCWKLKLGIIN
ncbi:MAG: glycoside hydrolase family 3 N-terminal domain-containing protein [Eubacteriales bacterium]